MMPSRIESRTRKNKPVVNSVELGGFSETESVQEETIIEDFSDGASDFEASQNSDSDVYDSDTDLFLPRSPAKPQNISTSRKRDGSSEKEDAVSPGAQLLEEAIEQVQRDEDKKASKGQPSNVKGKGKSLLPRAGPKEFPSSDLAASLSKLKM